MDSTTALSVRQPDLIKQVTSALFLFIYS